MSSPLKAERPLEHRLVGAGVKRPADIGLHAGLERLAPGAAIVIVFGDVETIDDRHAARKFALGSIST